MLWVCWIRSLVSDVRAYQAATSAPKAGASNSPSPEKRMKRDRLIAAYKARSRSLATNANGDNDGPDRTGTSRPGSGLFVTKTSEEERQPRERLRRPPGSSSYKRGDLGGHGCFKFDFNYNKVV